MYGVYRAWVTSGSPRMRYVMMWFWISGLPPAMGPDLPRSQARFAMI